MHQSARDAFPSLTIPLEGNIPHLYADSLGLVTVGVGLLVDAGTAPSAVGLALPFKTRAGEYVTEAAIRAEYATVKTRRLSAAAASKVATLFLDPAVVVETMLTKLDSNETTLARLFPAWSTWPADAQLAAHSMAWNFGPNLDKGWPNLTAALRRGDFVFASDNCRPAEGGVDRWLANRQLFTNAASVTACGRSTARLWYGTEALVASTLTNSRVMSWYVQRLLDATGDYKLALDGLFGPRSLDAWRRFALRESVPTDKISTTGLARLIARTDHPRIKIVP